VVENQVAVAEAQAAFIELMAAEGPIHRALLHLRIMLERDSCHSVGCFVERLRQIDAVHQLPLPLDA
jgi:hypothetical protein